MNAKTKDSKEAAAPQGGVGTSAGAPATAKGGGGAGPAAEAPEPEAKKGKGGERTAGSATPLIRSEKYAYQVALLRGRGMADNDIEKGLREEELHDALLEAALKRVRKSGETPLVRSGDYREEVLELAWKGYPDDVIEAELMVHEELLGWARRALIAPRRKRGA